MILTTENHLKMIEKIKIENKKMENKQPVPYQKQGKITTEIKVFGITIFRKVKEYERLINQNLPKPQKPRPVL